MLHSLSAEDTFHKLTQAPHSLATLAAAIRCCPHPEEAVQALTDHHGLQWCTACEALGNREPDGRIVWQRGSLVSLITLEIMREAHDLFCCLAELAHAAAQIAKALEGNRYGNSMRQLAAGADPMPKSFAGDGDGLSAAVLLLETEGK